MANANQFLRSELLLCVKLKTSVLLATETQPWILEILQSGRLNNDQNYTYDFERAVHENMNYVYRLTHMLLARRSTGQYALTPRSVDWEITACRIYYMY